MTSEVRHYLAQQEEYRVRDTDGAGIELDVAQEPRTRLDGLWDEMYQAIRINRDGKLMISLRERIEAEAALLARPVEPEYAELARLAANATPGPWFGPMDGVIASHPDRDPDGEWTLVVGYATRETRPDDAAYIAAASPDVVLRLLARRAPGDRELLVEAERLLTAVLDNVGWSCDETLEGSLGDRCKEPAVTVRQPNADWHPGCLWYPVCVEHAREQVRADWAAANPEQADWNRALAADSRPEQADEA